MTFLCPCTCSLIVVKKINIIKARLEKIPVDVAWLGWTSGAHPSLSVHRWDTGLVSKGLSLVSVGGLLLGLGLSFMSVVMSSSEEGVVFLLWSLGWGGGVGLKKKSELTRQWIFPRAMFNFLYIVPTYVSTTLPIHNVDLHKVLLAHTSSPLQLNLHVVCPVHINPILNFMILALHTLSPPWSTPCLTDHHIGRPTYINQMLNSIVLTSM